MLAAGKSMRPLFGLQYSPQSVRLRPKEIKFPARSCAVLAAKTPSPVDEFAARLDAGA
jgi:hypothetical protein